MQGLIEPPPPPPPEEDFEDDEEAYYDALDNDEAFELPTPPPPSSKIQYSISLCNSSRQMRGHWIPYVRFDGSMPQKQRVEVLKQFAVPLKDPNETESEDEFPVQAHRSKGKGKAGSSAISRTDSQVPVVMLISLKASALGLNLTAASRVFLMDPWWQSAIELQAIDRVN
ncbi:DNA helicase rad5 [Tulasnella sp. 425]|nr:DNA helicase rad5 [Tulasnella sp. 425]